MCVCVCACAFALRGSTKDDLYYSSRERDKALSLPPLPSLLSVHRRTRYKWGNTLFERAGGGREEYKETASDSLVRASTHRAWCPLLHELGEGRATRAGTRGGDMIGGKKCEVAPCRTVTASLLPIILGEKEKQGGRYVQAGWPVKSEGRGGNPTFRL